MHCRDDDPFLGTHLDPWLIVTVGRLQLPQLTACVGGSCLQMTWFQLLLGFDVDVEIG